VEVQNEKYSPGCQFNVNKTPGYNNEPFSIYGSPTTVDSWVHTLGF